MYLHVIQSGGNVGCLNFISRASIAIAILAFGARIRVDLSAHSSYGMSREQDPLLPSSYSQEEQEEPTTWRKRVAEALESPTVHKLVILLVRNGFPLM